jgi:hypothetical protein
LLGWELVAEYCSASKDPSDGSFNLATLQTLRSGMAGYLRRTATAAIRTELKAVLAEELTPLRASVSDLSGKVTDLSGKVTSIQEGVGKLRSTVDDHSRYFDKVVYTIKLITFCAGIWRFYVWVGRRKGARGKGGLLLPICRGRPSATDDAYLPVVFLAVACRPTQARGQSSSQDHESTGWFSWSCFHCRQFQAAATRVGTLHHS